MSLQRFWPFKFEKMLLAYPVLDFGSPDYLFHIKICYKTLQM